MKLVESKVFPLEEAEPRMCLMERRNGDDLRDVRTEWVSEALVELWEEGGWKVLEIRQGEDW